MMKVRTQAALLAILIATPAFAQQPPTPPSQPPARVRERADSLRPRMLNVESALRFRQQLKLSDAQANQLETLRKEIVAERQAEARDAIDTQSRVMAGLLKPEDVRKQREGKREQMREKMEQNRERIAKILTPEQQETLQREQRAFMRERMDDRRGRMGSGKHGREGRGPGFMPRPGGFDR